MVGMCSIFNLSAYKIDMTSLCNINLSVREHKYWIQNYLSIIIMNRDIWSA